MGGSCFVMFAAELTAYWHYSQAERKPWMQLHGAPAEVSSRNPRGMQPQTKSLGLQLNQRTGQGASFTRSATLDLG